MYQDSFYFDLQDILVSGNVYRDVFSNYMKAKDIPRSRPLRDLAPQRADVYHDLRESLNPRMHRKMYPNEA